MKKYMLIPTLTFTFISLSACAQLDINKLKKEAEKAISTGEEKTPLSNEEVIKGLKEALSVGTNNSTTKASKADGFFKNPAIKIPFPPEAEKIKSTVISLGMQKQVDDFVLTLNRAAEEASKEAAPIFLNAITSMTVQDGFAILKGEDNAATNYLNEKTSNQLSEKFKPIVESAIQKVEVTKYWKPIITRYNKVPFVEKQNPDLDAYVTQLAMEGMFKLIAEEELKIRKDPAARVSDLLKRVFGS